MPTKQISGHHPHDPVTEQQDGIARRSHDGYQIDAWRNDGKLLDGDLLSKTVAKDIKETVADVMDAIRAKANKP